MGLFDSFFGGSDRDYDDYPQRLHCPRCGSSDLYSERQGFSWRNAFWGSAFFGENGWLYGFKDSDDTVHRCSRCGYQWRD